VVLRCLSRISSTTSSNQTTLSQACRTFTKVRELPLSVGIVWCHISWPRPQKMAKSSFGTSKSISQYSTSQSHLSKWHRMTTILITLVVMKDHLRDKASSLFLERQAWHGTLKFLHNSWLLMMMIKTLAWRSGIWESPTTQWQLTKIFIITASSLCHGAWVIPTWLFHQPRIIAQFCWILRLVSEFLNSPHNLSSIRYHGRGPSRANWRAWTQRVTHPSSHSNPKVYTLPLRNSLQLLSTVHMHQCGINQGAEQDLALETVLWLLEQTGSHLWFR